MLYCIEMYVYDVIAWFSMPILSGLLRFKISYWEYLDHVFYFGSTHANWASIVLNHRHRSWKILGRSSSHCRDFKIPIPFSGHGSSKDREGENIGFEVIALCKEYFDESLDWCYGGDFCWRNNATCSWIKSRDTWTNRMQSYPLIHRPIPGLRPAIHVLHKA